MLARWMVSRVVLCLYRRVLRPVVQAARLHWLRVHQQAMQVVPCRLSRVLAPRAAER